MVHLGRFVLIETNGQIGEGYSLVKSKLHLITGSFPVLDATNNKQIGTAEVLEIGDKYYADIYDLYENGTLTKCLIAGRKNFTTKGLAVTHDRGKITKYQMTAICANQKIPDNKQVDKFPVVISPDMRCGAFSNYNKS